MTIRNCFLALLCLVSATANAGEQRALLIGISKYQADFVPLAGSINDVRLIGELLTNRFGFDPANVQTIVDENATREKIFAAIRALSDSADEDDIVFIHYSGHGSQAPDTNGDEEDGYDETIVPHDARTEGVADITDDELNALIAGFRARSVIVVLDSCHSGTGTRSGPSRVTQRWIAPDTRKDLYESVATRQLLTLPISENHILFAAAQDFESELDGPFGPNNIRLGLFTAALLGVLNDAPRTITPEQVIAGVHAEVETLKANAAGMPIPEPNLEAPLEKQSRPMLVFDGAAAAVESKIPPSRTRLENGSQQTSIDSIYATTSAAPQPLFAKKIASLIGANVKIAPSIAEADAVIEIVGQNTFDIYGPSGVVQVARRIGASGSEFGNLARVVQNAPALASLIASGSSGSTSHLRIKAAGVPETRSERRSERTVKVSVNTRNHRLRYYEDGAPRTRSNSLQIEVLSSASCYLTIASVNSFGEVYVLLPNSGQELTGFLPHGKIPASRPVLIPDSLEEDNLAGFHFDYAPPGGVDKVIAICLGDLAEAERLRSQLIKLQLGGPLSEPLLNVAARGVTGITPSQSQQGSDWAASALTLSVGSE